MSVHTEEPSSESAVRTAALRMRKRGIESVQVCAWTKGSTPNQPTPGVSEANVAAAAREEERQGE